MASYSPSTGYLSGFFSDVGNSIQQGGSTGWQRQNASGNWVDMDAFDAACCARATSGFMNGSYLFTTPWTTVQADQTAADEAVIAWVPAARQCQWHPC